MLPFVGYRMDTSLHVAGHEYPRYKISEFQHLGNWVDPLHRFGIVLAFQQTKLVACIDVTKRFVKWKGEGVYETCPCEKIIGGHCVVVEVLNHEDDYFIVRNSWGRKWGKGGFGKVKCNMLYNFSRPAGDISFMSNSETTTLVTTTIV